VVSPVDNSTQSDTYTAVVFALTTSFQLPSLAAEFVKLIPISLSTAIGGGGGGGGIGGMKPQLSL